ncbi:Uncharacterised protein [Mycobacterium tuberculosis]|uniref:Uncharacterized protein n=1 Tax=Mycobacterium tuberculosis TaxID=1773 RepID=A0A0U0SFZ7_MYCTX|nr:Uncharacterised protein [Mycobacterium tuberculosis]
MDADANGSSSKEANSRAGSSPSSSTKSLCTSSVFAGGTRATGADSSQLT